ncbi:FAD-dependent oxidoreductase [Chitinophaga sp. 22321]|uniref:FAD-dependent monooxygenase n=1 Tax=Chitinophaga hostae TaxID=2831022 RepID=A0ABS5J9E5_9BACT|nr:NAD(P)/FAD-dependent oxidoreductase [Chitinophaga hostae]MBS0031814.1 FAD-dependent monooxygenase [Chitinophaga hostae]
MKHITIIGGGIGGLCLAQGLKKANLYFTVYERNAREEDWLDGYRIHLRSIGAKSLHHCLSEEVWKDFLSATAAPTDGIGFLTEDMKELVHIEESLMTGNHKVPEEGQYNVSRKLLRKVLMSGIKEHIHYGKTFLKYELLENKKIKVHFEDGSTIETDILIGADGANSRIRKQLLPDAQRVATNAIAIGGKMILDKENTTWLPDFLCTRMNVVMPKSKYFFFNAVYRKEDENYILWSFVADKKEFPNLMDGEDLKREVIHKISKWHFAFKKLIFNSDTGSLLWLPLKTMLPVSPWKSGPVTLLGDAIHNMTPLQGMGANMALFDASLLLKKLQESAAGQKDLVTAISEYEAIMLKTGFEAVNTSLKYTTQAISANRLARAVNRTWFRLCNAVPFIKRMTFANNWKGLE